MIYTDHQNVFFRPRSEPCFRISLRVIVAYSTTLFVNGATLTVPDVGHLQKQVNKLALTLTTPDTNVHSSIKRLWQNAEASVWES